MKHIIPFILALLFFTPVIAQIGIPQIKNYSNHEYQGGTQNWEIDQDKSGVMYFANNEGMLTYNGGHWNLFPLPNKTIVRSLKIDIDGKIYVGGQDEIGYFFPNDQGVLQYHSLRELIPEADRKFADVWDISIQKKQVYFRTASKIFNYSNGIFKIYRSKGDWEFMGVANRKIIAQDNLKGLLTLENGVWETTSSHPDLKKNSITAILYYAKDTLLVTTAKNGMYLLSGSELIKKESKDDHLYNKHRIGGAIQVSENLFAFATNSSGCYIVDKKGNVVQRFGFKDGLQKDNIISLFKDKNQNLWLGLEDGIDCIAFNNAVKYIYPDEFKQTGGYAVRILNNKLYIGTSNGIYFSSITSDLKDISYSKNAFEEIPNTPGQIWNLNIINKKLLAAHSEGTFVVNNSTATQLFSYPGTWVFETMSHYEPASEIIAGTYNGLRYITFENGKFIDKGDVKGIKESLRFVVFDNNNNTLWASHPYRGIYRFKLSADRKKIIKTDLFTSKDGLPSLLNNYISKIKDRIVVATKNGIYEFDEVKKKFSPSAFLKPILGTTVFRYLNEDQDGNIWFVANKKVGVVDFHRKEANDDYSIVYFPELTSKVVAGFESIYPYNNENIFIGSNKGVIHINYLKYLRSIKPIHVTLTQVKASGKKDSIIFGGYFLRQGQIIDHQDVKQKIYLPYFQNSLHFEYSSTLFGQLDNIEFSYQLSGFDKKWSDWSSKSEKDYTNLHHGTYTFMVKARNNLGNESASVSYTFTIKPAWYQTYWIYLLYFLILCGIIYLLILQQERKHKKEQQFLINKHQLEIAQNEKEIVKLQNEKLNEDVNFKNQELASTSMHLVQRGQVLAKIKEVVLNLEKMPDAENKPSDFKQIFHLLNEVEKRDADWSQFSIYFDQVHSNFLADLRERHPNITPNELKLCAYMKMNLSSKEIAQIMSITIRAIQVSRYRLRKKLNIPSDANLFDYLMKTLNKDHTK